MMRIAMMNLVLHGIRHALLKRANALSDMGAYRGRPAPTLQGHPLESAVRGQLPKDSIRQDLPTNSKKSELLFLGVMMQSLAPGGRCAVVVPEGLLFGSTRRMSNCARSLSANLICSRWSAYPQVSSTLRGVKTAVLVFRRPSSETAKRLEKIWFYEVRNDGYDPDKISGGGRIETPEKNDIPDLLEQWKIYKASSFATTPGVAADTLLPHDANHPRCWWTTCEQVAATDYNLGAGQWKPRIAEKALDEDPHALADEAIRDYKRIVAVSNIFYPNFRNELRHRYV